MRFAIFTLEGVVERDRRYQTYKSEDFTPFSIVYISQVDDFPDGHLVLSTLSLNVLMLCRDNKGVSEKENSAAQVDACRYRIDINIRQEVYMCK